MRVIRFFCFGGLDDEHIRRTQRERGVNNSARYETGYVGRRCIMSRLWAVSGWLYKQKDLMTRIGMRIGTMMTRISMRFTGAPD